jgi:hypothetical protein
MVWATAGQRNLLNGPSDSLPAHVAEPSRCHFASDYLLGRPVLVVEFPMALRADRGLALSPDQAN